MKKSLYLIVCAAALFVTGSCQKLTTEGLTRTTYYPIIELDGGEVFLSKGAAYVEPGFKATLNGEDVSSSVTVTSNVNTAVPGAYSVIYSAVNSDGFSASEVRPVYVINPGGIDNLYFGSCSMGTRSYKNLFPIVINEVSSGVYEIDDLCGGFYCFGRYPGYEPSYDFHADTRFKIEADNSLTILAAGDWYFRSSFDYGNVTGQFDPATGTFDYDFDGLQVNLVPFE